MLWRQPSNDLLDLAVTGRRLPRFAGWRTPQSRLLGHSPGRLARFFHDQGAAAARLELREPCRDRNHASDYGRRRESQGRRSPYGCGNGQGNRHACDPRPLYGRSAVRHRQCRSKAFNRVLRRSSAASDPDSIAIRKLAKTFRAMGLSDGRRARRRKPSLRALLRELDMWLRRYYVRRLPQLQRKMRGKTHFSPSTPNGTRTRPRNPSDHGSRR